MNFSQIVQVGHLTKDPQLSYTPNQKEVCQFTVATNNGYGEKKSICFIDCVSWGKTAININKYFKKGSPILVSGELLQDKWTDKESGTARNKHKINVRTFSFLGSPQQSQQSKPPENGRNF